VRAPRTTSASASIRSSSALCSTSSSCHRPYGGRGPTGSGVTGARLRPAIEARKKLGYGCADERVVGRHDRLRAGRGGLVVASIPEVPGAHSQGRTREEARANVIDALGDPGAALRKAPAAARGHRQRAARACHRRVKRRDVERHLRAHGARLLREGGNHSFSFWGFDAERSTAARVTARSTSGSRARFAPTSASHRPPVPLSAG
jgi:hypothetical protein